MDIWQILMTPFSWILRTFTQLFNSYAVGLIIFSIVVKLILAPFQFKGKKSMIKMTVMQGQLNEIQKRCGNDKDRYNREVQEFYTKNGVNPMGGCGWSLLPLLVMWPLYAIIRRPFKYLMNLTEEATTAVAKALNWVGVGAYAGKEFSPAAGMSELTLAGMMNQGNLATAKAAVEATGVSAASLFVVNFNFLGMDLAQIPNWKFWSTESWAAGDYWGAIGLFLLPVISAGLSLVSMIISTKTNAMNKDQEASAAKQNRTMFVMMPAMSLWIGFTLPAGMCIYWIMNSLTMMIQDQIFNKMLKKDYEAAQKAMEEQKLKEKEEEKERRRLAAEKKAAALAAGKNKAKNMAKEERKENRVDVSASREGLRAYARGRAYDPSRYPVTPYHDPDGRSKKPEEEPAPLTEEEKALLLEEGVAIPEPEEEQESPETVPEEDGGSDGQEDSEQESTAEEDGDNSAPHRLF